MTRYDPFVETIGPAYEAPPPAPCPDCECCTAALCRAGRLMLLGCLGSLDCSDIEAQDRVFDCPCSAETTPATAAHLAARIREARRLRIAAETRPVVGALTAAGRPPSWWRVTFAGMAVIHLGHGRTLIRPRWSLWQWSSTDGVTEAHGRLLPSSTVVSPEDVAEAVAWLDLSGGW